MPALLKFRAGFPVDRSRWHGVIPGAFPALSLHTRVGLVLTALATSLVLVLGTFWLHGARGAIHEEVEAATRVSEQWLRVVAGDLGSQPAADRGERLLATLQAIGRVRANRLELLDAAGQARYVSPPPSYKAGRAAPDWFAGLLASELPARRLDLAGQTVVLIPDASRAVLDTWDDLLALAGAAGLCLVFLFVASRRALARALCPLGRVMAALDDIGPGHLDTRLPAFTTPELARLSRAFNSMADRLRAAVDDNVRLAAEREVEGLVLARLEDERKAIARELHDELAQGITAVRTLAGAIAQRSEETPTVCGLARSIVAVTGAIHEGVRGILNQLRPPADNLPQRLATLLDTWRAQHPEIALSARVDPSVGLVGEKLAQGVLRIVQEGLTNIVRHSGASAVELAVDREGDRLQVLVADNGRGARESGTPGGQPGCGLGLVGMRERIALLGGELRIDHPAGGGFCLLAQLPVRGPAMTESAS